MFGVKYFSEFEISGQENHQKSYDLFPFAFKFWYFFSYLNKISLKKEKGKKEKKGKAIPIFIT